MYPRLLGVTIITLLLSNCANMSESDCLTADWQTIGFEDGSFGKNETHISQHRQECAEHGITPDLAAYREGHFDGSKNFCTKNNGFSQGHQGKNYRRNCPEQFEILFLTGFNDGQTLYGLKKILHQRTNDLENMYKSLNRLEQTIVEKNELMIADGLNRNQRKFIRDEIVQHQQQQENFYSALPELKHEFESALQRYEQGREEFNHYLLLD